MAVHFRSPMNLSETTAIRRLEEITNFHGYKKVSQDDPNYRNYTHCSHAMIYARTRSKSLKIYDRVAIILMQMRFDGLLGFPGGGVDPGESPVDAINREIREESGWTEEFGPITESHYQFTHVDEDKKLVLHFFAAEVSEQKMVDIERNSMDAPDYGEEVLGNFRVPLYTMEDSFRGLPAFLENKFVGNAKGQLLETLVRLNLLSTESVIKALESKRDSKKKSNET